MRDGQGTPIPADEAGRLRTIRELGILDTPPDPTLDRLVETAARTLRFPVSLLTILDANRLWFKARHGVSMTETPRDVGFCVYAVASDVRVLEVPDMTRDPRFAKNPLVTGPPGFRAYMGAPLVTGNGHRLGTLCVLDHTPRILPPDEREILVALSRVAAHELELGRRTRAEEELGHALDAVERFLGVLSHDLRSPLATIRSNAQLLLRGGDEAGEALAGQRLQRIQRSSARMARLVDDLLDFSRIRQGKLAVAPAPCELRGLVQEVIDEFSRAREAAVAFESDGPGRLVADRERLQQLAANLLSNALAHAPAGDPVRVRLRELPGSVLLEVWNGGEPIPEELLPRLFEPFVGGDGAQGGSRAGLGLGLFIAKAIVAAHGGHLDVESARDTGTTFRVRLPTGERTSDALLH